MDGRMSFFRRTLCGISWLCTIEITRATRAVLPTRGVACSETQEAYTRALSFMDRLFGKAKPAAPKPTLADASGTLEKRGEVQDERIMKLDKELARYTTQLKTMKPGPAKASVQKRAIALLKQKKMYESQREQTRNQQFNLDQVAFAQESLAETANTVSAMKDANKALKKQFKAIDINQVEDMPVSYTHLTLPTILLV